MRPAPRITKEIIAGRRERFNRMKKHMTTKENDDEIVKRNILPSINAGIDA